MILQRIYFCRTAVASKQVWSTKVYFSRNIAIYSLVLASFDISYVYGISRIIKDLVCIDFVKHHPRY